MRSLDARAIFDPPRRTERTIVLAAMAGGDHVQVGGPSEYDGAYTLFAILDGDLTGWHRDERDRLVPGRGRRHSIHGEPVSFYRLRQENPIDIDPITVVPVGHIRRERRADSNA